MSHLTTVVSRTFTLYQHVIVYKIITDHWWSCKPISEMHNSICVMELKTPSGIIFRATIIRIIHDEKYKIKKK